MDETTTSTSSSSAAAVADSASAAASSKTTNVPAAASASAASTSVKLLIKASNQQFADQIIESDLLWTVKRLKTQLSKMYPSKPPVADQKLIYSGQLLNDKLQLKDVIRSYKDVYTQNHIFHLVYTPKNAPLPNLSQRPKVTTSTNMSTTAATASDGIRQRHPPAAPSQQQQQQQQQNTHQQQQFSPYMLQQQMLAAATAAQCPHYDPNAPFSPLPNQFNVQAQAAALATQQAAMYSWMQQVYAQYMEQYARLSHAAGLMTPPNATASDAGTLPQPFPLFQQLPFMPPNAAAAQPSVIPSFPSATGAGATFVAPPQEPAAAAAPVPAVAEQPQQAPRFPNIVQVEADNRDWLESFFTVTRLVFFLSILYFNSSPMRCLMFVIVAGGIYLYHIDFFRLRHERNNNNINRNNNAAVAAAAADQIRQGVQQVQLAQAAQQQQNLPQRAADGEEDVAAPVLPPTVAGPNAPADAAGAEAGEEGNQSTSVISFLRTFVVTFFTSLLPETPAL